MKKFLKNFITLIFLVVLIYSFRGQISGAWKYVQGTYFPCKQPIAYSIGTFDERFGISREDFIKSIESAEGVWEGSIHRNLFQYKETGSLKINLIYDARQEATEKLKKIDSVIDNSKESYDALKAKYEALKLSYNKGRTTFEARVKTFEIRKSAYEAEAEMWNQKGGAPKEKYDELQKEKAAIEAEATALNKMQDNLNTDVVNINAMANTLNGMAQNLNLNVAKFNEIGKSNGEEFEEGTYERDATGEHINIYQFDDQGKLVRVLTHELGHALGLDHVEDPKAIMYRLNNGVNHDLTDADITELKRICKIETK